MRHVGADGFRRQGLALAAAFATAAAPHPAATEECPQIVGWIEPVIVAGRRLDAKLDTGAETSSIDARGLARFQRDGRGWVRFRVGRGRVESVSATAVADAGSAGGSVVEALVVRDVLIKRAGAPSDRRPVVILPMCLGGASLEAEFTLTDRAGLDYPVLIGRAALGPRAVDSTRTHVTAGTCS